MPRRPKLDCARAARRLIAAAARPTDPEPLIVVDTEAAALLGETPARARGYVIDGAPRARPPVWLDAFHRPGIGWLTSRPAVLRLLRELYERDAADPAFDRYVLGGGGADAK